MLRSVFVAIVLVSSFVEAYAGGRVALVAGVSNYEHAGRLVSTLNDAKDMTAALKRLGFDVETLLDPSRSALEAAIRRYGYRSVGAEVSLFHFSGHALESAAQNWLLPATANVGTERDLRFEASVPVEEIRLSNPETTGLTPAEYHVIDERVTHRLAQRPGA